jgi:hypothetical protein
MRNKIHDARSWWRERKSRDHASISGDKSKQEGDFQERSFESEECNSPKIQSDILNLSLKEEEREEFPASSDSRSMISFHQCHEELKDSS